MSVKYEGKISFINHDKQYAMIAYEEGNKNKTVRVCIDNKTQKQQKEKNLIKKTHHFMVGDVVSFAVKLTPRGDRMEAVGTSFLYNNALDVLINKSYTSNKFIGYLKWVDDVFFVKEIESYLFFPVPFSPWQILPTEQELNEQVTFSLMNVDKKEKIFAELFNNNYIPEFEQAVKFYKANTVIDATVFKITAYGIWLHVVGTAIQAKLAVEADVKIGDIIRVKITYLSKHKIAVEKV